MEQCPNKMEKFLDTANEVLDSMKKEQEETKTLIVKEQSLMSGIKNTLLVIIIAAIGWAMRVEVAIADRPTYEKVVSGKDAVTVHRLSTDNIEKISRVLADSLEQLIEIKSYNKDYLEKVIEIYKVGEKN
jgi:hypothetical protein